MSEDTTNKENPYNNALALKEVVKMMKRKEKITISFVRDEYGYAALEIQSRSVAEKFKVQLNHEIYHWINNYLLNGSIIEPIPSAIDDLLKADVNSTNELQVNSLKNFLNCEDIAYMRVVPEIVDKPDRLTVNFCYPYGVNVFKIKRDSDILEALSSKGF